MSNEQRGERIAKLLARAGVASRRDVERMIEEGRVSLHGKVLDTPATLLATLDGVHVDGEPVAAPEAARLFLYHKPAGVLTAARDPKGRPTIYDRLPKDLPRLVPVGRLDLATEGLLLMTTDGGLKRRLELPATGVERAYRARAYGTVSQPQLETLIEGIEIEGTRYGAIDANIERRTGANVWIEMILTEGKNREVRRVLEHLGLQVGRLIRTRYGPFVLGDLPPGAIGEVTAKDLNAFVQTLGKPGRLPEIAVSAAAPRGAVPRGNAAPRGHAPQRGTVAARAAAERPARAHAAPISAPNRAPRPAKQAAARPGAATPRAVAKPRPATQQQVAAESQTVTPAGRSARPPLRKTGWARPKPPAGTKPKSPRK